MEEVVTLKISLDDRYEALRRHPKYCKDWEAMQKASGKPGDFENITKRLKARYQIPQIPAPLKYSRYDRIQNKPSPIEVIPSLKSEDAAANVWDTTSKTFPLPRGHRMSVDEFLHEGRYLLLKVNLDESIPALEKAIGRALREWKKKLKPATDKEERKGETSIDPWEVFDLVESERKTLADIARVKEGKTGSPSRNEFLGAKYGQVKRAYDKARKIMTEVIPG